MEIIDYKLNESDISLHNCCYWRVYTLCVYSLICTSSVVARWMSAPAWTSRSTISVWPFLLATNTGLAPSCVWQQWKIVKVWNTISTDTMCLKFKAEHAQGNTQCESLLHDKVSWYWLWSVQQRIHITWCIVPSYPYIDVVLDFCCMQLSCTCLCKNERNLHFAEIISISISQGCLCSEFTDCSLKLHTYIRNIQPTHWMST